MNKNTKNKSKLCIEIDKKKSKLKNVECSICYEEIGEKNYTITNCNHIFCNNCLFRSLNLSQNCPYCREPIFNFDNRIKNLTRNDIDNLESESEDFRNQVSFKLIYELKKSINLLIEEENKDELLNDHIKNILKSYLKNEEINKKINNNFYTLIKKIFSIISITSYENVHNWLKNK